MTLATKICASCGDPLDDHSHDELIYCALHLKSWATVSRPRWGGLMTESAPGDAEDDAEAQARWDAMTPEEQAQALRRLRPGGDS